MRRLMAVSALAAALAGSAGTANAADPAGHGLVHDADFFSVSCTHGSAAVVAADVIETRGGGPSVWLPTGQHLIAFRFQLTVGGVLVSDEHYGVKAGLRTGEPYVCTASGTDPVTGAAAIGVLIAYPVP